ncbi:hypothetical protein B0A49_05543 [Cryomyces minteri]|uniref:Steroid 5-alpha reductase C-terminal domain-containing protein n=1 Tax=Cryomyces minteri TaxID=331657 RepID=A0A4U0XIN3_9PEZI|nr:hypothetical protein B0A49_05543 [Cryomyces minteri]
MSSSKNSKDATNDWYKDARRKGTSVSGIVTFVALRALDLPIQYYLLRSNVGARLIQYLGGTAITIPPANTATVLGLPPYYATIVLMATGSAAKQIYWATRISEQVLPPPFAILLAAYNTVLNSINTILSVWAWSSNSAPSGSSYSLTQGVGLLLYGTGLFTEWYCEVQRKRFKQDPRNQGKPYSGGLFGLATNINYGGYTLWRTGYALYCAGLPWAGVMVAWLVGDFCARAIPSMEGYCQNKYGDQWTEVRRKVPYRLLPWIY